MCADAARKQRPCKGLGPLRLGGSCDPCDNSQGAPAVLQVSEGMDVLMAINDAFVDEKGIPIQNIRIRHTIVLEDPFEDPKMLSDHVPEKSPEPEFANVRKSLEIVLHGGCENRLCSVTWYEIAKFKLTHIPMWNTMRCFHSLSVMTLSTLV